MDPRKGSAMPEKGTNRKDEIELDPKGWDRFETAVSAAVRAGPGIGEPPRRKVRGRPVAK